MDQLRQLEEGYHRTAHGYIFYRRAPAPGPKLVMLHGLGADSRTWRRLLKHLPAGFDIYMPDLLGHGRSDAPDIDYTIGVQLETVIGFMHAAGVRNPVILGNSYGAWIAALYASGPGSECAGAVFEDSAGLEPFMENLRDTGMEGSYSSWLLEQSLKISPDRPHVMSSIINNSANGTVTEEALSRISCPSLVVWGRNDDILPFSLGQWMCGSMPKCRLIIIEGADHVPHISQPDATGRAVSDFLSGLA